MFYQAVYFLFYLSYEKIYILLKYLLILENTYANATAIKKV